MTGTGTNLIYIAFMVILTFLLPALLWIGTSGSWEGILGAILSFAALASYVTYTLLLGAKNS